MKNDVSLIFSQHLDFLPSSAVYLLAKQFVKRYSYVYSSAMREDAPDGILGEIEAFLFEEIRTLIRRDPRLDLRYPDEAIQNLVLLLTDSIEHKLAPQWSRVT